MTRDIAAVLDGYDPNRGIDCTHYTIEDLVAAYERGYSEGWAMKAKVEQAKKEAA